MTAARTAADIGVPSLVKTASARRILVRPEGDRDSYAADLGKRIFVVLLQSDVGTDPEMLEWQPT
jgi:hypothetical protein